LGKFFYSSIISSLSSIETTVGAKKVKQNVKKPTGFEHNHLNIIEAVNNNAALNVSGGLLSKFESHKSVEEMLYERQLASNDGLVSNMSLVMELQEQPFLMIQYC
jgi:hypothetical protein